MQMYKGQGANLNQLLSAPLDEKLLHHLTQN